MGEAWYFAKVQWEDRKTTEEMVPKVLEFLKEIAECSQYWQSVRGSVDPIKVNNLIISKYKKVFDILDIHQPKPEKVDKYLNYLSGKLNSPLIFEDEFHYQVKDCTLYFQGRVWNFANWGPLMEAMKTHFKAIKSGYVSKENLEVDYYDYINMT